MAVFDPKPDVDLKMVRQWPHLLIANGRKLVVLGPGGRELEHDLKLGQDTLPDGLVWVGGQAWVGWGTWQNGWQRHAYWTSAPQDVFDVESTSAPAWSVPIEHPDAIVLAPRRFSVGDGTAPPQSVCQWADRHGAWALLDGRVRAIDPGTGSAIDGEPPAFLADVLEHPTSTSYYPVPDPIARTSRLGVVDGQWGAKPVGGTLTTLSGHRYAGSFRHGSAELFAAALVWWPGADRPRAVVEQVQWWRNGHNPWFYVADPDRPQASLVHDAAVRMAHAWLPPLAFWHYLVPRDPEGSRALRAIDRETAAPLLGSPETPVAGVTDPELRAGVAHGAGLAAELELRRRKLLDSRTGGVGPAAVATSREVGDGAAAAVFGHLRRYSTWGEPTTVTGAIRTVGGFLARGTTGEALRPSRLEPQEWIGRIRGVAVSLTRPGTRPEDRDLSAIVLRAWLAAGLADDGHYRLGMMTIERLDPSWMALQDVHGHRWPAGTWSAGDATNRIVVLSVAAEGDDGPWAARFVEWASGGAFRAWPGAEVTEQRQASVSGDAVWLETFLDAFAANGPRRARAEDAAALAEATGLSVAEAAHVLAGLPEEMDKATREGFGLEQAAAKAAAQQFPRTIDRTLELLVAAAPADPRELWTDPVGPLAKAFVALRGRQVTVPVDLLGLVTKELGRHHDLYLKRFAAPASWKALAADGAFDAYELALLRSAHPGLMLSSGPWQMHDSKSRKAAETFFEGLGGALEPSGSENTVRRRSGPFVALKSAWTVELVFRPSELDEASRGLLRSFVRASGHTGADLDAIELLRSEDFAALVRRVTDTPLAPGQWEHDPAKSAPEVVAAIAHTRGLSAHAATLYLQTLALLEPTKKNVLQWNGWTAKIYAGACQELVTAGLLLEGKRARAGREHYLPGGWCEETTILPYEEWKRPLYGFDGTAFPVGRPQPGAPLHVVLARAWERVLRGDGPRFEEVRR